MARVRRPKLTIQQVEDALIKASGIHTDAALMLNVSRQAISKRIATNKRLQAICAGIVEETLDLATSKVYEGIRKGDKTFVIFYLKTKGRHRGWVEGQHIRLDVEEIPIPASVLKMSPEQMRAELRVLEGEKAE